MSSRAARITSSQRVQSFQWGQAAGGTIEGHDGVTRIEYPEVGRGHQDGTFGNAPGGESIALDAQQARAVETANQQHLAALEREAFTKGYSQGERSGLEAGGKRADAMLRRLAQTLEDLSTLRKTMISQTERQMVQLSLAIAKRVIRREVTLDHDLVVAISRVALDRLGESASATIRLNPEDFALTAERHGDAWAGSRVAVVSDPGVSRGGCLVESDFGFIDAGVEAQFEQLTRELLGEGQALPVVEHTDGHVFADAVR